MVADLAWYSAGEIVNVKVESTLFGTVTFIQRVRYQHHALHPKEPSGLCQWQKVTKADVWELNNFLVSKIEKKNE